MSEKKDGNLSLRQIISSVLAAALGVQSDKNRQRDFENSNVRVWIIAGIIFGIVFVSAIIIIVRLVLETAR